LVERAHAVVLEVPSGPSEAAPVHHYWFNATGPIGQCLSVDSS